MWFYVVFVVVLVFGFVVFRGAPYVPSHKKEAWRALDELYPLSGHDTLLDVGSGDGIILRLASKKGARAIGIELNPILVGISKLLCFRQRNAKILFGDFWLMKFPDSTTVVYAFSVSRDSKKLVQKMQRETTRLNHELALVMYGPQLKNMLPVKTLGAHTLYKFQPVPL